MEWRERRRDGGWRGGNKIMYGGGKVNINWEIADIHNFGI